MNSTSKVISIVKSTEALHLLETSSAYQLLVVNLIRYLNLSIQNANNTNLPQAYLLAVEYLV